MVSTPIRKCCGIAQGAEKLPENGVTKLGISARARDRILKVARTIADLEAAPDILLKHLSEPIQYRTLDCSCWASIVRNTGIYQTDRVGGSIDLGLPAVLRVSTPFLNLRPQR